MFDQGILSLYEGGVGGVFLVSQVSTGPSLLGFPQKLLSIKSNIKVDLCKELLELGAVAIEWVQ